MKGKKEWIIILTLGIIASHSYSQSKQIDDNFFNASLDTIHDLRVYLPDGYDSTDIKQSQTGRLNIILQTVFDF